MLFSGLKKDTCLLGFTKNYITRRATEHERAHCARQQGFYNQMQALLMRGKAVMMLTLFPYFLSKLWWKTHRGLKKKLRKGKYGRYGVERAFQLPQQQQHEGKPDRKPLNNKSVIFSLFLTLALFLLSKCNIH